ncbi:60S acidic ribosomal protein P2 [Sesamum angolense]|uniref:60S acidic ribosomal protein P2 n=1 Tax=Sesamum angolense TaxID=2727404 RepID=A0AAE1WNR4_9LAMI|nr:60S acidic ribosomal protein P2 [Sesamum angolense]
MLYRLCGSPSFLLSFILANVLSGEILNTLARALHGSIRIAPEMKIVAAYLLAVLGGNTTPSAEDLKDILGSGFWDLEFSNGVSGFGLYCWPFDSLPAVDVKNRKSGQVGAEADEDRIELLLAQVKGKDITELIAAGREKLASVPAGGGAVAAAPVSGGAAGGAAPAAAAEAKKEEKVEEKEESDDDMGFSLFD